jgi:hypothetical protein
VCVSTVVEAARALLSRQAGGGGGVRRSASQFVAFFLGLAITAGILVPILLRLRSTVGETRAEKAGAGQQLHQLKKTNAALEDDLKFITQFLKDFPRLARELYSGLTERQIPAVLLNIVQRSLDPQHVAVLVRRSDAKGEKGRPPRLVVAAAYPDGTGVKVGAEIRSERARSASRPNRRWS